MSKKIKNLCIAAGLALVIGASVATSACGTSKHPNARITIEFNQKTYVIDYTLYRNMYPQTVQHFIELADSNFYNDTIIHDYKSSDYVGGAYAYDESETYGYSYSYSISAMADYLQRCCLEDDYYDMVTAGMGNGTFSSSVFEGVIPGDTLSDAKPLPTVIGEFSNNGHKIVGDKGLKASFGSLKMVYYAKDAKGVTLKDSFGDIRYGDYANNCATSLFALQMTNSTSYDATKYAVFGQLKNSKAQSTLEKLSEDIYDYVASLGSGKWTSSVTTNVDKLDTITGDIETKFTMTSKPIIIKSVKITKH